MFSSLALAAILPVALALSRRAAFKPNDDFNDRLQTLSLIGSHFGPVDIPASYDYVIVGGGTAGLTLANRLAVDNTVAVVEAGGFYEIQNSNYTQVPGNDVYYLGKNPLWNNPLIDWFQYTTPQAGLYDESVLFSQGHTLGGGSARNFMWYHRGPTTAYEKWAEMTGDDDWLFENFNEHMKSPVQFTPPKNNAFPANATPEYLLSDFDKKGGPLQVSYPQFLSPAGTYISAGMTDVGLEEKPGMNNGDLLGWTNCADTIDPDTQTRDSSESSMLRESIKQNFNLQVYTQALAKKINFNSNKKATGVDIEVAGLGSGSVTFTLNATKEVIVSAGAFRSPQLLMVSGIGPAETLNANGVDIVAESPGVGQNMMDHIWVAITREVDVLTAAYLGDYDFAAEAAAEYVADRTGIYTNPAGTLIAFEKLPNGTISESTRADLEELYGGDWPHVEYFHQDAYASTNDDYLLSAPRIANFTALSATVVAPFSRGSVSINSTDTKDHPLVNPNWLTDPRDMEVLIAGFKRVRDIWASPAVAPVLIGGEVYPGENITSDADIEDIIRKSADTVFHPASTCRMGGDDDEMAVLDSKAKVRGVKGLRVVDASAFPVLPPGMYTFNAAGRDMDFELKRCRPPPSQRVRACRCDRPRYPERLIVRQPEIETHIDFCAYCIVTFREADKSFLAVPSRGHRWLILVWDSSTRAGGFGVVAMMGRAGPGLFAS